MTTKLIPVGMLHHHPDNPPSRLDDLHGLTDSIREAGLLQPLLVEPDGPGRYLVVAGNRRLAAAISAGLAEVLCVVRDRHDTLDHRRVRLIENGHRRNLSPMEQAREFGKLLDAGLSQAEIAQRTGFSPGHVSGRLLLLSLDDATQARVESGQVNAEHAINAVRAVRSHVRRAMKTRGAKAPVPDRGSVSVGEDGGLTRTNPVAQAAHARCKQRHGLSGGLVGSVACGSCWEFCIRADERWQIEEGDAPDPVDDLDEIAIQRAMTGAPTRLTPAERVEAIRRMRERGMSSAEAGDRLKISGRQVLRDQASAS